MWYYLFWTSVFVTVYTYFLYPVILGLICRYKPEKLRFDEDRIRPFELPMVSLVIAAYKEEKVILERIQNALMTKYPADRFEILIGCDGNEDLTGELVESIDDSRVRLFQYPVRRGKASVLNDTVPEAKGDIIVFSDANTMMDADAIGKLVRHFQYRTVGGVCGQLILTDPSTGKNVDGVYWKYENFLKRCEAKIGSLLGVNGAIYAIRRELYQPIPANTIIDDFLIGMKIHQQRKELIYDAEAVAREETAPSIGSEFHRRSRIGAGAFQSLVWLKSFLNPAWGLLSFSFWSHKVLRWFCPLFLLAALISNAVLIGTPLYQGLFLFQVCFYASALIGFKISDQLRFRKIFKIAAMFVGMNAALFVGLGRWISGIRGGTWKRTERSEELNSEENPKEEKDLQEVSS